MAAFLDHGWPWLLAGIAFWPGLAVALYCWSIPTKTLRDSYRVLRSAKLKEGYSVMRWPDVVWRVLWWRFKEQVKAHWQGYEVSINP